MHCPRFCHVLIGAAFCFGKLAGTVAAVAQNDGGRLQSAGQDTDVALGEAGKGHNRI
jgi:hypothetical protein